MELPVPKMSMNNDKTTLLMDEDSALDLVFNKINQVTVINDTIRTPVNIRFILIRKGKL